MRDHEQSMVAQDTSLKIAAWLRKTDEDYFTMPEPLSFKCKHGQYEWNDCAQCSIQQAADAIERGDWK